ncbi:hypothetical protein QR680_001387 [Steinernema hermaphroditum]|uniref:Uncharacterized protein n=1 Tax=Steinernema hermaphroditum TaxID=289476 RepID=A0AA39LFC7_9BILA|nr:hypothetical protein QR680_001387 [Steinernema hermaphroditum]
MFRLVRLSDQICSGVIRRLYVTQSTETLTKPMKQQIDGVIKTASTPFDDTALAAYSRVHFDDSVNRDDPEVQRLKNEIMSGSRAALAAGITLVESKNPTKRARGNYLLSEIMTEERKRYQKHGPNSLIFRIGISGSPGVGKSSFIEALGHELTLQLEDHYWAI